ncbi:MAG: 16S rRNA (guanine(966)-N(2))-methyltransferase RsmD [Betaproteobacteria bacterium]
MTVHSKPSASRKPNDANRVRIIGGEWRSRLIEFSAADGLRPTANRVRETLFNWLGQTLQGLRCLDLFAGSGALGFEAASRGAAAVVMVESSRLAFQALRTNKENLLATQCRLVQQDAAGFLARNQEKFDVVFLDPPFGSGLLSVMLVDVEEHLSAQGVVYAEWGEPLEHVLSMIPDGRCRLVKRGKAGAVHFGLLSFAKGAT